MKKRNTFLALLISISVPAAVMAQTEQPDTLNLPGYTELDEVVIETERPVLQSDGAKTTYNVTEDPAADSSTAMDILRKVPMISVDGDGNIRLNGQSNFKIQVDGMENPMLKQYSKQILESMPAANIYKIEVITEPGAKEDAEGVAGVINIITQRKQSNDGYSGNVSLRVSNRDVGPSLYGIIKKDRVTLSANFNYQYGFAPQKFESENDNEYLTGDMPGRLEVFSSQKMKFNYVGGNINLSWEPNEKNLFTVAANVFSLNGSLNPLTSLTKRYDRDGSLLFSFDRKGSGSMDMFNVSSNVSYRHNFAPEGNYLILSYLFNFGQGLIGFNFLETAAQNYQSLAPYEDNRSNSYDRSHTVQLDYANDFKSEHHLMEVGAKGVFRRNSAISRYYYGADSQSAVLVDALTSDIDQLQDVYAAYASYTGKFEDVSVLAGLRYEHSMLGISNMLDRERSFRNHLNDVVPNAAVTWSFGGAANLRAAYQMRISRPSVQQINPFEIAVSPLDIRKGNPDLTSERSHKVSLTYTNFGRVFGGNIGVEYTRVNNSINSITYLTRADNHDVIVTSYANIGRTDNVALNGFATWSIIRGMTLMLNGRLEYAMLRDPGMDFRNHGWTGTLGGAWNYTIASVNKITAYGGWFGRRITLQGHTPDFYYYGISASRDFLADKSLTLSVSANNFLQRTQSYNSFSQTPDLISYSHNKNLAAWNVGVSIAWKFGSLKAKVKETGADVNNDDVNKSSNNSSGVGGTGMSGGL